MNPLLTLLAINTGFVLFILSGQRLIKSIESSRPIIYKVNNQAHSIIWRN